MRPHVFRSFRALPKGKVIGGKNLRFALRILRCRPRYRVSRNWNDRELRK